MKKLVTALILLIPSSLFSQSITVPEKVEVAQPGLIVIRASKLDADDVRWWSKDLQQFPPDVITPKPGVFLGFCTKEGTYTVGVVCAKAVMGKAVISDPQHVTVIVGKPTPPPDTLVIVPNVIGKSSGEAITTLTALGLKYAVVGDNTQPVASQAPPAGVNVPIGSTVTLTCGQPPSPAPIPGDGLRVLIVYETADIRNYPAAQALILYSKSLRDYLDAKCPAGTDGKTKEWRIWDQNVDTANESKLWQDTMKRPHKSLPWIIVSNGKTGFEGPLPADIDSTLKLLKQYGGE